MNEAITLDELIEQLQVIRERQQNGGYSVFLAKGGYPVLKATLRMPLGATAPFVEVSSATSQEE